ncbi:MAG: type secretion system secreted protein Hcp [Thermoanaerobaculia bacterium]|nr:type secretion system secreted protein Hcp [Thermoanaerobaculia bacterium]
MATNMYIKFENPAITGASNAPGHVGEIEILSWSHGFVQPTGPTRSGDQSTHPNLSFTKYLDQATNDLLKYSWSGKQFGKTTITCYRSDSAAGKPVLYLTLTMQHVVILNYSVSGGPGDIPVENVSLDYGTVQYTYIDQKHGDSVSTQHDLETRIVK